MYNKRSNYSAGNYELCTDNFDEHQFLVGCPAPVSAQCCGLPRTCLGSVCCGLPRTCLGAVLRDASHLSRRSAAGGPAPASGPCAASHLPVRSDACWLASPWGSVRAGSHLPRIAHDTLLIFFYGFRLRVFKFLMKYEYVVIIKMKFIHGLS